MTPWGEDWWWVGVVLDNPGGVIHAQHAIAPIFNADGSGQPDVSLTGSLIVAAAQFQIGWPGTYTETT